MNLTLLVVDAFARKPFCGNPAAVCFLERFPSAARMQEIASEMNLSETAFAVRGKAGEYALRWFTPQCEVDLCGHATLAAAHAAFRFQEKGGLKRIRFETESGSLAVVRDGDFLEMDRPAFPLKSVSATNEMEAAIGRRVVEARLGRDLICALESERDVIEAHPDLEKVARLQGFLLHVTARGTRFDCVSRTFGPKAGVPEDPVCGSGHCHLAPYWSSILGTNELRAWQASRRGGFLRLRMREPGRVAIAGQAVLSSVCRMILPDD